MGRYLITYVYSPQSDSVHAEVFKLVHASEPDEVTVPTNTLIFFFVNSDFDTPEELQAKIVGVKFEEFLHVLFSFAPFVVEKNGKIYCIGKNSHDNGEDWIVNSTTKTRLLPTLLGNNYEVIDM